MAQSSSLPAVEREVTPMNATGLPRNGTQAKPLIQKTLLIVLGLLFAAATLTYSFVWMYYVRWDFDAEIGLDTKTSSPVTDSIEIINLYPGGPAERAGIKVHDEIIAIDGTSLATADPNLFQKTWLHRRPGETVTLTIRRPGQQAPLNITATFRAVATPGSIHGIAEQVVGSYPIVFLVVGLAVLFLRLQDRNAWLLAVLCAGLIAASPLPPSTVAMSASLQAFMFAYRAIFIGVLALTFYLFFAGFPQRSPLDRRAPWLKWLLGLLAVVIAVPGIPVGHPQPWSAISRIAGANAAQYGTLAYIYGTLVLTLVSLCWSGLSTSDPEAKRKFRVITWGTLVGMGPITLVKLVSDFGNIRVPFWLDFIDVIFLTLFPLSFAYAVVRYRVLEIPVLLKQSARYVLVRRGFAFLLLLMGLSVNVVLGIALSRLFQMRPGLAMSIGTSLGIALAWISAPGVRRTAERIDRAFFRGSYDARVILQKLAQSVRSIQSREQLPQLIEKELELALHPRMIAVYLRDSQSNLQPPPQTPPLPAIAGQSLSANHLLQIKQPIDALEYGDFSALIPALATLRPECLVPVLSRGEDLLGLIVLGAKRSEEPYSHEDKELLGSVADQTGLVLESIAMAEKIAERIDADRRAQQELQIARAVQSKLLPQQSPPLATLDYAGACIQARAVGGDYYDFLDLGPGRVGFVLADISGKGISAALLMANLQASLRSLYPGADRELPRFLHSVNHLFVQNTEVTHYATVFFGVYDDASRKLLYVNCGHNPPLLLRASGEVERLNATATVLGLFEPWECSVAEIQMFPGDILAIYTDGVTEAANHNEEEFGEERLISLLRQSHGLHSSESLHKILQSVQEFAPGEQADDLTTIIAICK
ncbi:MAG: SpoIIE family protein phosphatase [Acidobacteriia bacterium]|nr:SpoIIE family protein phosphatase [Terriglobia bacterium]